MKEIIDFRKIRKVPFTEVAEACRKVRRVMSGEVHENHICSDLEKELWCNRDKLDEYIKEEFNFIIPQKEIQIPEFLNRKLVIPESVDTQKNSEYEETSEEKEPTDELIDKLENAIKLIKLYGTPTRSKIYIDFSFDDNCVKHRVTIHHNTKQ